MTAPAKLTRVDPEHWAAIPGTPNYEVSHLGRVRSTDRVIVRRDGVSRRFPGRTLKPTPRTDGRLIVTLPGRPAAKVHQLVLEAFVGPRPAGLVCRHLNGNHTDNRLANLRWGTHLENAEDMRRHGTHYLARRSRCPRGHALEAPNLRAASVRRGVRGCLACQRAYAYAQKHPGAVFEVEADRYYAEIMAEVA